MDSEPDQVPPSKNHQLFCNPNNPATTMVMLKNIEHMGYFHKSSWIDDSSGKQVYKFFPNYFILNNITIAHKQKKVLHAMLQQQTDPEIMIEQFCKLARACYPDFPKQIDQFQKEFKNLQQRTKKNQVTENEFLSFVLAWYSNETFFYKLLNRLLRAGKDSTELYYAQHGTYLLNKAIKQAYHKQKRQKLQQLTGNFKCYRGAYFSEKELEQLQKNVGRHIETLGFMSTSLNKLVAIDFIDEGNTLVEIQVASDALKDEQLDLGYAYLEADGYGGRVNQKEVLFNVLSSFQIKSVSKLDLKEREVWHIKLQHGVTYQMMHNYKQNKLIKGTAEQQEILAILSWQNSLKGNDKQEDCLNLQNEVDGYIWLKKTKISLLKSIPQLQQFGRREQFKLYHNLTTDGRFKGKELKYVKEIQPRYFSSINSQNNNQSTITLLQNMANIYNQILANNLNSKYRSVQQLAKKWRQLKQNLLSDTQFQSAAAKYPQNIEIVEQQEIQVSVFQAVANILLLNKKGDKQKLRQQIQAAQPLQQLLLTKYHRYHPLHMLLRVCCMNSAYNHGWINFETYLEFQQQGFMMLNCLTVNQQNTLLTKLVYIHKQANRHIQHKQWAEAVKLCADFRDNHYKGRGHQDEECFKPIINQLNKKDSNLGEKVQILQASLSVKHPKDSAVHKIAGEVWKKLKQKQVDKRKRYTNKLRKVIVWSADLQLAELMELKQEKLPVFESKDSRLCITAQYLFVNALRMVGRYQEANRHVQKLEKKYSATKHRQFFCQLMRLFDS